MSKQSFITILLSVLMSMTGAKASAHDISVKNSDDVTIYYVWNNNKTELAVSYRGSYSGSYSNEYSGNVVIPSSVVYNGNTYPVTSIGSSAFSGCCGRTSVTIPNSVTSIGNYAFSECSGLTSVTIPNSVTSIGNYVFSECSGLTSITIPNSVTSIGGYAFYKCSGLTSVTIPNSVTSIGDDAFSGCDGLTSVTIPNSVTSIGQSAFEHCSLETIVSEIKTPFEIGYIGEKYTTLIVPVGTKAAYQSTAGWSNFTNTVEVGEGGFAGCRFENDGICYVIGENNTASLTSRIFYFFSDAVSIPSQVEFNGKYYNVTSIGQSAFSNCSSLTSVTIPNSVTSINDYAFMNCNSLTSVTIGKSVTSIGYAAFGNCNRIITIISEIETPFEIGTITSKFSATLIVPAGTKAAYQSTAGWSSFTKTVEVGEGGVVGSIFEIDDIYYKVGENNTASLTSANKSISGAVTISDQVEFNGKNYSVTSISESAFSDCTGLTSVTIPNSVTSIGSGAFSNCSHLTSVNIPNNVTSIGSSTFDGCSGLISVTIPNSVTSIGKFAFRNCYGLKSVIIGSGILSMDSYAFYNTNLKKTIWLTNTPPSGYDNVSSTVNYVSNDQFNIRNKVVYKYLSSHFVVDGIRYVPVSPSDRTCDAIDCTYDASIENINIGETVTNKGVTLTVMNVNPYTCYGNYHIKDVKLSFGGDIGDYAFFGCTGLITATVSNKGSIGTSAFQSCKSLTTAAISNQGTIGASAFQTCSAMTTATINNQGGIDQNAFSECPLLETAELGQKVTSIGDYTFSGCSKLKSIVIPDAVITLGSYAFQNCTAMTSAKIGNGIETIAYDTFLGCSSLNEINIGSKVKTINGSAFSGCSALPSITIPQAVTTIGNYVFSNCTSLTKVTIADSETTLKLGSNGSNPIFSSCPLDYVYIGRDISYQTSSKYGYSPFYRNTKLREVKITDKETEISENEFYGCTNLQTVTIGDGVTTIGNWAFSGCSNLEYFTFGTKLESIGQEAFSDCTALVRITSKSKKAPACGSQALEDINKWECKLNVPKGYLAVYQEADQWKDFWFMEEGEYIPPMKGDVNSDGKVNQDDLRDLVEYIMGNKPNGVTDESADVNGDNKVNVADVVELTSLMK